MAFDLLNRELVLESMKILGADHDVINWLKSYFSNRQMFVQIGESRSELWNADLGVVQGGKCSGELYNIASITQSLWNTLSVSTQYADDGLEIVIANSENQCQKLAEDAANKMVDWYKNTGFSLNTKKSELMSFNFKLQPINIGGVEVHPKSTMKFLGIWLQSDLKWNVQIESISKKIRCASVRVRNEGKLYKVEDRRKLYFAWIQGLLKSNMLAYVPYATNSQIDTLQTALNAGVRAIVGIKKYGYMPITEYRKELGIPSVRNLLQKSLGLEAWRKREMFKNISSTQRSTRAKSLGKVIIKNEKGWKRETSFQKLCKAWNDLSEDLKCSENEYQVKKYLSMVS